MLIFLNLLILFNFGCKKEPTEPPIDSESTIPQWAMFRHDARHTGNVNTPIENIEGPHGDSVSIKWKVPIDGGVIGSPAIGTDGTIYFGTENSENWDSSSFYAINPDGTIKWRYTPFPRTWSSPAIGDNGSIYVGSSKGFYAFTPSGEVKWKRDENFFIISSPAIGKDGTIYYTNYFSPTGYLNAVNPNDGSIKWQIEGADEIISPSVANDGTIYYSDYYNNKTIIAANSDGTIKWEFSDSTIVKNNGHIFSIEIGADGKVYFISPDIAYLYALNSNGILKWKKLYSGEGADPCLDLYGNIYSVSNNGLICAQLDGKIKWQVGFPVLDAYLSNAPLTVDNSGIVYIGLSTSEIYLLAYDQNKLLWKFDKNNLEGVTASPAIGNGSLYFAWDYGQDYFYCFQ